ncbi:hypothetical protein FZC83_10995 [Rossellomorea marisflavi]|jgi:ABC-type branched-subunit amino acid transport system ATPase component|uniref:Uncharacterized protein n=1 Tax=Rossellomorea marisflavi TaxID=189381 RepID=A0A5D4RVL4_9BACI|nr:hypothetical protein [Rossellomorea marisflavi]KQU60248.1 hypothetical protein ASG66_11350 [Bacillus sp. Leaf406]MDW4526624.1 hypothetical protein [Rossellomorea marisflavi]TYS53756.1 hypothetical protein FZC83_10995 [Rossellomorea marisflavi]WJV17000.1 hypothetical protein QU593_12570 [Rossellomorea marisflavi]
MIDVKVNQAYVKEIYLDELKKGIKEAEKQTIFWHMKELVRQNGLSVNTVQNDFFYEPDFPRYKVGRK